MMEYQSSKTEEAKRLNEQAVFERGTQARQWSDDYVRVTVILATILLLTAVGQRFKIKRVRIVLTVFSALLL